MINIELSEYGFSVFRKKNPGRREGVQRAAAAFQRLRTGRMGARGFEKALAKNRSRGHK